MNVLVIGKPKYNVILALDSYITENAKVQIDRREEMPGGVSVYVACMLAKWGMKVYYVGAICGDEAGNKIKDELEKCGVDTKFIDIDYEHKTNVNYVIKSAENGSSTEIEVKNDAFVSRYKYDILPDYIITDGSDMGAIQAAINNYPMAKIILLANKVNDEYYNLSKKSAYVCANISFAKALTKLDFDFNKPNTLVELFQKIKDLNKAEYILMLRDKGVLYNKERQVKMIPAIKVEKKDDANSGSAFFGAYAYGIINNRDIDEIAKISNIAGALSLTKIGTLSSIPDKKEVYEMAGIEEKTNELEVLPTLDNESELPKINKEETTNETL